MSKIIDIPSRAIYQEPEGCPAPGYCSARSISHELDGLKTKIKLLEQAYEKKSNAITAAMCLIEDEQYEVAFEILFDA